MNVSPRTMGIVYFLFGVLLTYAAIQSATETIWNFFTILLAIFATFDFGIGIRMFIFHFKIKQQNKK